MEGTAATRFFRACPNNDGGPGSLPQNARIKIVLKDVNGSPVPGISPADICILFNAGTSAQGFSGVGADSVISNDSWNTSPQCPMLTCIPADAPTDANGVTYITFAGATPGSPGVATRDPSRKWGHFDSSMPVYVLGRPIAGRLTSISGNGTYALRIRNFDSIGGLYPKANVGAVVNHLDLNALVNTILTPVCPISYWLDFDGNGSVNVIDMNLLVPHLGHDCDTPNNP